MKNKKRNLILIGVFSIILFLALAFITSNRLSNITNQNNIESKMIAYVEGHKIKQGGGVYGGDLWIMNVDDRERKKITENSQIQWIHDWSPDNKYVAVIKSNDEVSVVNSKTGEIIELGEYRVRYKIYWISDTEIAFLQSNKLSIINIENKTKDDLVTLPDELLGAVLSNDIQWIAANDGPLSDTKRLYSYNLAEEVVNTLTDVRASFGGWLNENIIYATDNAPENAIWEIDPRGDNKRKLIDIGDSHISYFSVSKNNNAFAYITAEVVDRTTKSELYVYDYYKDMVLGPLNDSNTESKNKMSGLEISKNGKYISYHLGDGVTGVDLNSGEIFNICDLLYCDASWSN